MRHRGAALLILPWLTLAPIEATGQERLRSEDVEPAGLEAGEPFFVGEPVDLEVRGSRFADVMERLLSPSGTDFIVGSGLQDSRVDVQAMNEPWDSVLARIFRQLEVGSSFISGALVIGPLAEPESIPDFCRADMASRRYLLRESLETPELKCGLERIVGERGSVDIDSLEGVLFIDGPLHRLAEVERWLTDHDAVDTTAPDNDPRLEAIERLRGVQRAESARARAGEQAARARQREKGAPRAVLLVRGLPSPGVIPPDPKLVDTPARTETPIMLEGHEPWGPPCLSALAEDRPLSFRRRDARSVIEGLPAPTCDVEAVPEALAVLEDTVLSGSLSNSDLDGTLRAVAKAVGLYVDGESGHLRFVVERPW